MTDGHTQRLESALAGRYKIQRKLGEGGMASVYLAEDLKHERKVALKILKPELAAVIGAERFLAEIKTTANLQHPHILPLFDSGESDGFLYYVMPYIDGETLRDKLDREKQLGVDEAVRIATSVADALDYAHRQGVIHRDIKPANILLHDGRPIVADFGIAVAISAAGGGRMTETGLSLGTPHYMSPEQASADRDLSARSDVYSLGCVLYEMIAGQPPHTGPSAQSILVRILTESPRTLTDLRHTVPAHVSAVVMKSIEKLPADRFDSARDFMDAVADPTFTYAPAAPRDATPSKGGASFAAARTAGPRALVPWGVAAVAVLVAAVGWVRGAGSPELHPPVRATVSLDPEYDVNWRMPRISPDGTWIAVVSRGTGILVRDVSQAGFRLLEATQNTQFGVGVTFSPNGEWLAFVRGGDLFKIAVSGSSPITLVRQDGVDVEDPHWGDDGTIVFASHGALWQVSETGGDAAVILPAEDARDPRGPSLLPGGAGVVFTGSPQTIEVLDLSSGEVTQLVGEGADPRYVATGHVLYVHPQGGLFALPFDLDALEADGAPIPVMDEIGALGSLGYFDVSANGTLVFGTGAAETNRRRLMVLGPEGQVDTVRIDPPALADVAFSPDGGRITFNTGGGVRTDDRQVFVYDLVLERLQQLSFEGGHSPQWSPDGAAIVYSSEGPGTQAEDLWIHPADGASPPRHLISLPGDQHAKVWPADSIILFSFGGDIHMVNPLADSAVARPYVDAEYTEDAPDVSPDGRFAAYQADETSQSEVYVREFPTPRGKWRISDGGGQDPAWSADGRFIYYVGADRESILRTRVQDGATPIPLGTEEVWRVPRLADWDLDPATGRALVAVDEAPQGGATGYSVSVIVNWFEELKRLTGGGNR